MRLRSELIIFFLVISVVPLSAVVIEASKGKTYVSDVYQSGITGPPEIIITSPVSKNGDIVAVLAARVSLENLYRIIEKIDIGKSGEVFIVNQNGDIIFHENRSRILLDNIKNNFAVKEVTYEKNGIRGNFRPIVVTSKNEIGRLAKIFNSTAFMSFR